MSIDTSRARVPGFPRRLAAVFYDAILVFGMLLFAATIVVVPYLELIGPDFPHHNWLYRIFLLTVACGFYIFFWVRGGQTLGMRVWRFRLVRRDGQGLTYGDALKRLLWAIVTLAPAGLGLLWVLIDRDGLSLYDRLSRTGPVMLKT